jgi:putative transposase
MPAIGSVGATCVALGLSRASLDRGVKRRALPPPISVCRSSPPRTLPASSRKAVLDLLRSPRFADLAPAEISATLLDESSYHCSISTMYRILWAHSEVRTRR